MVATVASMRKTDVILGLLQNTEQKLANVSGFIAMGKNLEATLGVNETGPFTKQHDASMWYRTKSSALLSFSSREECI